MSIAPKHVPETLAPKTFEMRTDIQKNSRICIKNCK